MTIRTIRDRFILEKYFRCHPYLHLYALGDLDDFLWPHTTWHGCFEGRQLKAVCLVYNALNPPVLLALAAPEYHPSLQRLVAAIHPNLPRKIYAHLNPGLKSLFKDGWQMQPCGLHLKMGLQEPPEKLPGKVHEIVPITREHIGEIYDLFQVSHPVNDFDPGMVDIGPYLGIRNNGRLVCIGGVHVYSTAYKVAALGNIVTHPQFRGQGMAAAITLALCQHLSSKVDLIGLNVKADNTRAIRVYHRCGFRPIAQYDEVLLTRNEYL